MLNAGVYKWTSPSGKSYVGQSNNLKRRKREFLTNPFNYSYTGKDSAIDRARRKYNEFDKWSYEVLGYASTKEELDLLEKKYIKEYNTTNSKLGYNSTEGGDGTVGNKWGTEKQIQALKNRRSYLGENNPNFGKNHTEETRKKISELKKGTKASMETLKKLSKPVNQYTMSGEFVKTWIGAAQASKELGIDKASISRVCKGKKISAGGFKWCFSDEV